ncbi:MAG: hypothetical protein HYY78_09655 [Betaproteobacteria bacterium]|nr:hypothetical protein [Betaproteobacteria bacterium]
MSISVDSVFGRRLPDALLTVAGCWPTTRALWIALFALLLGAAFPAAAQTASGPAKYIPTFLVYYGGGPALIASDAPKLAKFDLIDIDRFRYDDISPNTWASIKAFNPDVQIYLYEMGPEAPNYLDGATPLYLNGLGRYNVSRGHSMGSLNGNHSELFLRDASGNRVYSVAFSNVGTGQYWHLMDFGSTAYQSYWVEAVKADVVDQPWVADGVFTDNCLALAGAGGYSATPQWYSTNAAWSGAMNSFASAITAGLHVYGQKLWCNRGSTQLADGFAAWLALDASAYPPDVVAEEGAFAVKWATQATRFYPEADWKRQIDVMGAIKNSKIAIFSHTALAEGQSGTDNWGKPVTFWQSLWYSLGSFLLGKNDQLNNAYFMFRDGTNSYNKIQWYDEYEKIDLGRAIGPHAVTTIGSVNVYWREFERGYVYVNPTPNDVASLILPQASRRLTHDNLNSALDTIPIVSAIALNGHHAAILVKTDLGSTLDTTAPSVPTGLVGTAVSASQINLSWNPSTDNVGVTGYYVYLNDVALATTTATSFAHTGLAAGATYNYRVSAYDAVPNHSAWTAPVSVTTPVPDTQAPSVPTGLVGTVVSASQISLTWNPSTDNVGVAGYYVYLNDQPLATTTATLFSHTGLTAGATYNYRVSAYDAVPNHSAWTALVSATTPVPDTTAPSTPTGLSASGASTSQIDLSWAASTDNVGVTGYRVYRDGALLATLGSVTTYQDTGLAASTAYSYTVQAIDAAGNASAQSAPASATTQAAPDTTSPTVSVTSPASGATVSGTITVSASASDNVGVVGVQFKYNGVNLGSEDTTAPYSVTADTTTVANGSYTLTAVARDAAGNLTASAPVTVTVSNGTPDTTAPSVPTGLVGTAVSSSRIDLSWNPSTDNVGVKGYYVYLNDRPLATTTTTSFSHTGLAASTTYSYRVSAYDAVPNHSAWTTPVSVTTRRKGAK